MAITADARPVGARRPLGLLDGVRTRGTFDTLARLLLDRRALLAFGLTLGTLCTIRALLALGALLAFSLALWPVLALIAIVARLLLLLAVLTFITIAFLLATRLFALRLLLLLGLLGLLRGLIAVVVAVIAFAILVVIIVDALAAGAALLVVFGAAFAEYAEIMVCELQPIFGLDAVTGELRIARQALVFFEQLRRIATLTLVAGVAATAVARHSLGTLSTATATAATVLLTIVDQRVCPCGTGAVRAESCPSARSPFPPKQHGRASARPPLTCCEHKHRERMSSGVGRRELFGMSGAAPALRAI